MRILFGVIIGISLCILWHKASRAALGYLFSRGDS